MKKLNSKLTFIVIVTLFFAVLPKVSFGQIAIPYPITNLLPCSVTISWSQPTKISGGPCGSSGFSGSIAGSGGSFNIPVSSFAGCGGIATNMTITVLTVNGVTVNIPVSANPNNLGSFTSCTSVTGYVDWTTGGTVIHP